jgi:limonene-1,2-epoxide hydrolase
MDANEVVTRFCDSVEKGDLEETLRHLDADCRYHNIPLEPVEGVEAIRKTFEGFGQIMTSMRFEVLHQVATGDVVMNERVDHFVLTDGKTASLPVTGVFEVKDGKITGWRDYFDVRQFEEATGIKL